MREFYDEAGNLVYRDMTDTATRIKFHSCECIYIYDSNITEFAAQQRCVSHNSLNEALTHDRDITLRYGDNPTKKQNDSMVQDRVTEKAKSEFRKRD